MKEKSIFSEETDHEWIYDLDSGHQVYWFDPDQGLCSRLLTIKHITLWVEEFKIEEPNGDVVEGYISELCQFVHLTHSEAMV